MKSISVIDAPLIFTALVSGTIVTILLILPVILYYREISKAEQTGKTYAEIAGKVIALHIVICMLFAAMAWLWNASVGQNDAMKSYSIKYGTAMFLGMYNENGSFVGTPKVNGEGFWTMWEKLSEGKADQELRDETNNKQITSGMRKAVAIGVILIGMANTISYIGLLLMPLFCTFTPFILMTRRTERNKTQNIYEKVLWYSLATVSFLLAFLIHSFIADAFVNAMIPEANFSFFSQMQSIWQGIFNDVSAGGANGQ